MVYGGLLISMGMGEVSLKSLRKAKEGLSGLKMLMSLEIS